MGAVRLRYARLPLMSHVCKFTSQSNVRSDDSCSPLGTGRAPAAPRRPLGAVASQDQKGPPAVPAAPPAAQRLKSQRNVE